MARSKSSGDAGNLPPINGDGEISGAKKPDGVFGTIRPDGENDHYISQVMAMKAAGLVTWEWDIPTGIIRYGSTLSQVVRGAEVEPYCSVETLMPEIHPDDRDALARSLAQSSTTGEPWECEYRARMLDGTYR